MQEIEFYCRKCKKSLKMAYALSGVKDAPVMTGMIIRCHTNRCARVVALKKFTEGQILSMAQSSKCYI